MELAELKEDIQKEIVVTKTLTTERGSETELENLRENKAKVSLVEQSSHNDQLLMNV